MSTALVHIGVPKTGSTSFQQWIYQHRDLLLDQRGITLYDSVVPHVRRAQVHPELLLLAQRPERDCVSKLLIPEWSTPAWQQRARDHLAAQVAAPAENLLFTHEGLFLLRHPDEIERLLALLAPRQVRVVVCLREPAAFLRSYRAQMRKNDHPLSTDPASSFHLEESGWISDWEQLLAAWRSVLGEENVVTIDYEQSMATFGSTTQPLLEAFGIDTDGLPPMNLARANRSRNPRLDRVIRRTTRRVRRLFLRS